MDVIMIGFFKDNLPYSSSTNPYNPDTMPIEKYYQNTKLMLTLYAMQS